MITLTEQMIRDFGLTGAMAGEIATPEDIAIMNATQPTDPMSASLRLRLDLKLLRGVRQFLLLPQLQKPRLTLQVCTMTT